MFTPRLRSLSLQAIWFTDRPGVEGPVFGSNDNWNGLGVFLDSFDNDALVSASSRLRQQSSASETPNRCLFHIPRAPNS